MNALNLSIELPFKIGDKIWMDTSNEFEHCNFLDRYKRVKELELDIFTMVLLLLPRNSTMKVSEKKLKN